MRSETEMFSLILNTARHDDRIRAVILNGSRANPNSPRDCFQDFDIIYIVTDLATFKKNPGWIKVFGELMILQLPDDMGDPPPGDNDSYAYLMQFVDGNRIDLTLFPLANLIQLATDSLSILLLDKDGIIEPFPPSNESDYLPTPPTAKAFVDCCNEFWWVCPYVAKGLWREELPYARYMLDQIVRDQLIKMLVWYIGIKTNFIKYPGKFGKYLQIYLEPELWHMLLQTYADASYQNSWEALLSMCNLFRIAAVRVAEFFDYRYPFDEDARVSGHLEHVRCLPKDANEIY
jgi:aminoglycoside 6-adenylyltransferase